MGRSRSVRENVQTRRPSLGDAARRHASRERGPQPREIDVMMANCSISSGAHFCFQRHACEFRKRRAPGMEIKFRHDHALLSSDVTEMLRRVRASGRSAALHVSHRGIQVTSVRLEWTLCLTLLKAMIISACPAMVEGRAMLVGNPASVRCSLRCSVSSPSLCCWRTPRSEPMRSRKHLARTRSVQNHCSGTNAMTQSGISSSTR